MKRVVLKSWDNEYQILLDAANSLGVSVGEFVLSVSLEKAQEVLKDDNFDKTDG